MSTAKFDTLSTLDGSQSVPVNTVAQGSAKAWVNFNGMGTVAIRASFNVSSITDNGTGDYTVNFTNAMVDANYVMTCLNWQNSGNTPVTIAQNSNRTDTASLTNVTSCQGAVRFDASLVSVAIFR